MAIFVAAGSFAACGTDEPTSRLDGSGDEVTVAQVERFAGVGIPADAEVLGAVEMRGIDRYVEIAVRVPVSDTDTMIAAFESTPQVINGSLVSTQLDDVDFPTGDHIVVTQASDQHTNADGDLVSRSITVYVDGDSATVSVVAFTT